MTLHWVANPSTSPECGCGWIPTEEDIKRENEDVIAAVEQHVLEQRYAGQ